MPTLLHVALALAGAGANFKTGVEGQQGFGPPTVSDDGSQVAITRWDRVGLETFDVATGARTAVSAARGAGFAPDWDGNALLFKAVTVERGQEAIRWDAGQQRVLARGGRVGQPVANQGRLFSAIRGNVLERDAALQFVDAGDVDIIALSPAADQQAWNDDQGTLYVRETSGSIRAADVGGRGAHPAFSSSGKLLVHSGGDEIRVVHAASGRVVAVFPGEHPAWTPGADRLIYDRVVTGDDVGPGEAFTPYQVVDAALWTWDAGQGAQELFSSRDVHPRWPSAAPNGDVYFVDTQDGALWRLSGGITTKVLAAESAAPAGAPPPSYATVAHSVPYMHQLWDTPDDFDGGWSCGATSVLQTLARYETLPNADITASWPTPHTSHWGWYVPNAYSFNGYTYDTWGLAKSQNCQGAHGFICLEYGGALWSQMVLFAQQHGMPSELAGTSFDTLVNEVNAGYTMYLSASVLGYGHIVAVIGYLTDGGNPIHAMAINDPYGNAGSGDWGNFDGENVVYDWPGYNNGYLEIEVAQLFTARGTLPPVDDGGTDDGGATDDGTVVDDTDAGTDDGTSDTNVDDDADLDGDSEKPSLPGESRITEMPGALEPMDTAGGCAVVPRAGIWALVGTLALTRRKPSR